MPSRLEASSPSRGCAISVKAKFANRFYEPIVFLDCLNQILKHNRALNGADLLPETPQSAELAFHYFLNKLGQLCDSKKGGDTVTSFAVLNLPDGVQYRFASNQRTTEDLARVRTFVTSIIKQLGEACEDELRDMTLPILRKSLSFTRPRVQVYVKSLEKNTILCIEACMRSGTEESQHILEKLEELRELLQFSHDAGLDHDAFSERCEMLIIAIDRLYRSEVDQLIRDKTNEGRMNESECWYELRHAAGRLLSYLQAAKVLVSTRRRWPELFEKFEIYSVASSVPGPCPLRNKHKVEELSMWHILGRMTSDPPAMESYRAYAVELEKFGLNDDIRHQAGRKSFRPIVHAEILLLDSLERDGGTHPSRFFNNYRYIGCGKPTCKLCDYYFRFHRSGVEVRPGHRNLYSNWRTPDVYKDQGPKADKERERLMNRILDRIREDTLRTMREKVAETKPHDSNTEPTYPIDSIHGQETTDIEHLTLNFQHFNIGHSRDGGTPSSSRRASFTASDVFATETMDAFGLERDYDDYDEEEEYNGGVLLW